MSKIKLNIDGQEVYGFDGQTILDIARKNGIEIPTLCHDERVEIYGSCGLCTVEVEGIPKLLRSCSTFAADNMIVKTNTDRIRENRKAALELLLSDHVGDCRPPCAVACPGETDCQGYVGLIANGNYEESLKLIKDKIPLPSSIGRVCPHPCETACRRKLVEEPISIAALKYFAGDFEITSNSPYLPDVNPDTGKSVAVVGGGPGGLSAAYYLRQKGHSVTIYDAMPQMGGMLRYGIPEYRLPKKILNKEIEIIGKLGVVFKNNIKIGRDITLDFLENTYDSVIVAVGAWESSPLRCPGEDLEGVIGGIDFLRNVAINNPIYTGKKVAVVGGGNTAMDACRTAVRLGASEVYNIYRRTKNEMPAEEIEIVEAEEEGVIFKNLTNPIEVLGDNGKVKAVRLQIMALGEPDASGRRAPVPVEGKEETIEVDTVLVAIGQKLSPLGFEKLEQTKWGTILADEETFRTSVKGVFAIGDATNKGADIAIAAIGEAKKAAQVVDGYLRGEEIKYKKPFLVNSEKTADDFAGFEKKSRVKLKHRSPEERKKDFLEINIPLTKEEAEKEAHRCLECGCHDYFECKLIDYANQYKVEPQKYDGKVHHRQTEDKHPFIQRNPDKCILCGLCVRICDEVVGAFALGLVNRGFETIVKPALDTQLRETDCISCGQCVNVCPTGALTEKMMIPKQVPLKENYTETICSFCSVGCKTNMASKGNLLIRSLPSTEKDSLLCVKGRFGFGEIAKSERITTPFIRKGSEMEKVDFTEAVVYANKSLQALTAVHGNDSIGVAISDRYTNEEAFLIKEYANKALKTDNVFSFSALNSGITDIIGKHASTASLDELENTDVIFAVFPENIVNFHGVAAMRIKRAVNKGVQLIVLSAKENILNSIADLKLSADMDTLKGIAKELLDGGKDLEGYELLAKSLESASTNEDAAKAAEILKKARKAVFIHTGTSLSYEGAKLSATIAVLSGHSGSSPRDGIIELHSGANTQGLINLGIKSYDDFKDKLDNKELKGLFIFGEDVKSLDSSKLEFLAIQELKMTETAAKANVVFPASAFSELAGTFTGADGRKRQVNTVVPSPLEWDSYTQIMNLSANGGAVLRVEDIKIPECNAKENIKYTLRSINSSDNNLQRCGVLHTNYLVVDFYDYMKQNKVF